MAGVDFSRSVVDADDFSQAETDRLKKMFADRVEIIGEQYKESKAARTAAIEAAPAYIASIAQQKDMDVHDKHTWESVYGVALAARLLRTVPDTARSDEVKDSLVSAGAVLDKMVPCAREAMGWDVRSDMRDTTHDVSQVDDQFARYAMIVSKRFGSKLFWEGWEGPEQSDQIRTPAPSVRSADIFDTTAFVDTDGMLLYDDLELADIPAYKAACGEAWGEHDQRLFELSVVRQLDDIRFDADHVDDLSADDLRADLKHVIKETDIARFASWPEKGRLDIVSSGFQETIDVMHDEATNSIDDLESKVTLRAEEVEMDDIDSVDYGRLAEERFGSYDLEEDRGDEEMSL